MESKSSIQLNTFSLPQFLKIVKIQKRIRKYLKEKKAKNGISVSPLENREDDDDPNQSKVVCSGNCDVHCPKSTDVEHIKEK